MSPCRWVAAEGVRIIPRRHHEDCDGSAGGWHPPLLWGECRGCQPCTEPHCVVCNKEHADGACPDCLDDARSNLDVIAELVTALPDEVENRGVDSEAMMLLGPVADPRTWHSHADTAARGLLCKCERRGEICPRTRGRMCPDLAAYLEDCRDELHPLWVLGTWEQVWRDHLDHQTEALVTLEAAISYLDMQMTYVSGMHGVDFKQFSSEIKACRAHLEDVLRDGIREETGAPCLDCGTVLVKTYAELVVDDHWLCSRRACGRTYNSEEFARLKTHHLDDARAARFLKVSEALGMIGRPEQTLRTWMANGSVETRRDDRLGWLMVWWPDVREMHLKTPMRKRKDAA